jgi:hypothetical protein
MRITKGQRWQWEGKRKYIVEVVKAADPKYVGYDNYTYQNKYVTRQLVKFIQAIIGSKPTEYKQYNNNIQVELQPAKKSSAGEWVYLKGQDKEKAVVKKAVKKVAKKKAVKKTIKKKAVIEKEKPFVEDDDYDDDYDE